MSKNEYGIIIDDPTYGGSVTVSIFYKNCGYEIVADPVNSYVHADSGFAGCGLSQYRPYQDGDEYYAEPKG